VEKRRHLNWKVDIDEAGKNYSHEEQDEERHCDNLDVVDKKAAGKIVVADKIVVAGMVGMVGSRVAVVAGIESCCREPDHKDDCDCPGYDYTDVYRPLAMGFVCAQTEVGAEQKDSPTPPLPYSRGRPLPANEPFCARFLHASSATANHTHAPKPLKLPTTARKHHDSSLILSSHSYYPSWAKTTGNATIGRHLH